MVGILKLKNPSEDYKKAVNASHTSRVTSNLLLLTRILGQPYARTGSWNLRDVLFTCLNPAVLLSLLEAAGSLFIKLAVSSLACIYIPFMYLLLTDSSCMMWRIGVETCAPAFLHASRSKLEK